MNEIINHLYAILRYRNAALFPYLAQEFMRRIKNRQNYKKWIHHFDIRMDSERTRARNRLHEPEFKKNLISILMPVYNTPEPWLCAAIESVHKQWYPRWELCIADDCSTLPHVRPLLEKAAQADPQRIKVVFREHNGHISECSNSALDLVQGTYVALMDHDDVLPEQALYWVAEEINAYPHANIIYTDEDKIDQKGIRFDPHFKCDWNEDLFFGMNFLGHLCVFRTQILNEIGGFRKGFEGSQDYDLILRAMEYMGISTNGSTDLKEAALRIRHIPKVLYHWRAIPGSVALNSEQKKYAHEAARRAIDDYFKHIHKPGIRVTEGYYPLHRVHYPLPNSLPLVSVIICAKNGLPLLKRAVEEVLDKTDYSSLELIIINPETREQEFIRYLNALCTDARIRVLPYEGPFNFPDMNNRASGIAQGEVLLFSDTNIRVKSRRNPWLREMVSHALRPEVGPVGCKLIAPNGRIRHGGILLGIGGVAEIAHRGLHHKLAGYFGRAVCAQQFLAVTSACMAIRRKIFEDLGGFDVVNFPEAYSDVDLCLRAREQGYRTIWTPFAELYYHKSASPGSECESNNDLPANEEKNAHIEDVNKYIRNKWVNFIARDPFYNPNLNKLNGDFTISV